MRRALALIPAYTHIDWRLQDTLRRVRFPYLHAHGCADITRVRSRLLCDAMKTEAEVFIFIDADMAVEPDHLSELVASPKLAEDSAVSGCYVNSDGQLCAVPTDLVSHEQIHIRKEPRYIELLVAGMGFAAVHRDTVKRMEEATPPVRDHSGETWHPYFLPFVLEHKLPDGALTREYVPEDYSFWWRVRTAGRTPLWLDTHLAIGHVKPVVLFPQEQIQLAPSAEKVGLAR